MLKLDNTHAHIIVIGTGGTGGWLCNFLPKIKEEHIVTVIDGDSVEEKNLIRQNFTENEINHNKARVLRNRYELDNAVTQYLSTKEELKQIIESINAFPIIVGCVDNNTSRKIIHDFMHEYTKSCIWLDSGNSERTGQVIIHALDEKGDTVTPFISPIDKYEELKQLNKEERHPNQISCAEQTISAPQNVATNILSATTLFMVISKILNHESLFHSEYQFNTITGSITLK